MRRLINGGESCSPLPDFQARRCRRDLPPRSRGRGKFLGVLLRASGAGRRPYFSDQVTGRLAARSGLVCANFFWFVYSRPVTWLSVEFQPTSLLSAAISSRRLSPR